MLLSLSADPNARPRPDGRRCTEADTKEARPSFRCWMPVDSADGLIRIGTQSAIIQPEAGKLLRKLMVERGLPALPLNRTLESVCVTPESCDDVSFEEIQGLK